MNPCENCGGPLMDPASTYCSDHCRYGHLVRRREAIQARRGQISEARMRAVPRKPAWRAATHHNDGRTVSYCCHRHRTRGAAVACATKTYDPMNDLAKAERWPPDD